MNTNLRMSQLRGILYQPPTDEGWQALCRLLYAWPLDADLDLAVEYTDSLLAHWPDDHRRVLGSWWRAIHEERYARLWPLVRCLELWYMNLGDRGAIELAQCPQVAHLTHLSLPLNAITDRGALALAESPYLSGLTHLDLAVNEISDEGFEALITSENLSGLTHLNLQKNRVGDFGAVVAAQSPELGRFQKLHMAGNPFADLGAGALASTPHLPGSVKDGLLTPV